MRTAVFYSCKGGSGRTLTLANVGSLLVRLGFDVLALDLDLEAPGVPEAFALKPKTDVKEGFVEYARAWLKVGPAPALPRPHLPVVELEQKSPGTPKSKNGPRLRMIRAGDYDDPVKYDKYATFMWGGALEALYPLPGGTPSRAESKRMDPDEAEYVENYTKFWRELKDQIALDPPDYLLVDARTGFSPLSGATVDAFLTDLAGQPNSTVDLFVFADLGSEASRLGTRTFVRQLAGRLGDSAVPRRTYIVRREQVLAQSVDQIHTYNREEWLGHDADSVDWLSAITGYRGIRSDPEVELSGARLASPDGELEHRALLDDYVSLTALLLDEQSEEELRAELKLRRAASYKLFKLLGKGGMFNVADSQPNVSFTERTFHSLVAHVMGKAAEQSRESLVALSEAGRQAGVEFADIFHRRAPANVSVKELVGSWQELESQSGWGLFELEPKEVRPFLAERQPRIRVFENAFAPPPSDDATIGRPAQSAVADALGNEGLDRRASTIHSGRDRNLCVFLGGYLSGILSRLSGTEFDFDPDPKAHEFCRSRRNDSFCEFKFSRSDRRFAAKVATQQEKICLIYTGGTIGMKRDYEGKLQPPDDANDFLRVAPELRNIVEYDFEEVLNKDSTNVVPGDWAAIAAAIYARRDAGYKGFVVVHGTDTMHFSASAVAFALGQGLPFPVVFTGAQTIPEVHHGDARINLLRACAVAKEDLAEVVIAFGDYVFRGARAQKKDERKFDAFESPAMPPLGEIGERIRLSAAATRRRDREGIPFELKNHFESGVLQVSLIPGLEPSLLAPAVGADEFKGLILQSFGAGNVPDENAAEFSVIPIIEMAVAHGKPVIVTSQFPANTTEATDYAPGRKAIEAGAIPTGNMTASCSVAKFRWALGLPAVTAFDEAKARFKELRKVMSMSYIGELDEENHEPANGED